VSRRNILSNGQRAEIVARLVAGTRAPKAIAREYGVSVNTVYALKPEWMRQRRQPPPDLTGELFGSWVVLRKALPNPGQSNRNAHWVCQCTCGALAPVRTWSLVTGRSTRCIRCRNLDVSRRPRKRKKED